jgi:hypothetical protein
MSAVKTAILARQFMAHIDLFMFAQDSPLPLVTPVKSHLATAGQSHLRHGLKCASLCLVVLDHDGQQLAYVLLPRMKPATDCEAAGTNGPNQKQSPKHIARGFLSACLEATAWLVAQLNTTE